MTEAAPSRSHRALTVFLGVAAVIVAMIGLKQFASIVAPAFLALNLMIVVWPLMSVLKRFLPKIVASIITGLAAITILGLFFWSLGWAGSLFVREIPQYKNQGLTLWSQLLSLGSRYGITSSQVTEQLQGIDPSSVVGVVGRVVSNVSGVVSLLVVVISVLLFMIIDSFDFDERLQRLGERHNPVLLLALQSFAHGVRRYWVTSTIFGLIVALVTWAGLVAIGVPLAIVWAVLSFVTNYIPNIGFVIGLLPAAIMAFLTKGLTGLALVVALYSLSNFIFQSIIQPKFTGEAVGVTSTVSFLSLLVWAFTLGPLGALLALPATQFMKAILVDADPNLRWLNALIASDPKTSDEEPVLRELVTEPLPMPGTAPGSDQGRTPYSDPGGEQALRYGPAPSAATAQAPSAPDPDLTSPGLIGISPSTAAVVNPDPTGIPDVDLPEDSLPIETTERSMQPDPSLPDTAPSLTAKPQPADLMPARLLPEPAPAEPAAEVSAEVARIQSLLDPDAEAPTASDTLADQGAAAPAESIPDPEPEADQTTPAHGMPEPMPQLSINQDPADQTTPTHGLPEPMPQLSINQDPADQTVPSHGLPEPMPQLSINQDPADQTVPSHGLPEPDADLLESTGEPDPAGPGLAQVLSSDPDLTASDPYLPWGRSHEATHTEADLLDTPAELPEPRPTNGTAVKPEPTHALPEPISGNEPDIPAEQPDPSLQTTPPHPQVRTEPGESPWAPGAGTYPPRLELAPDDSDEPDEPDEPKPQRKWDGQTTEVLPAISDSAPRRAKERLVSPAEPAPQPAGPTVQTSATPRWTD